MTVLIILYGIIVAASIAGLALKDVRLHGASLACALILLILLLTHTRP